MPTVDFNKTCDAGCRHSEAVVRAAALFTREQLDLQAA